MVTTFAFPNLKVKQCVVKVQLRWEGVCFWCSLTPISTIEDIKHHVNLTFEAFPRMIPATHSPCKERFVMHLSAEDLRSFGEGSIQEPARNSIIVRNETWVYKKPFWLTDDQQLDLCVALQAPHTIDHYAIKLEVTELRQTKFYRYRNVRYDPLSDTEVLTCLRDFYSGVHDALEKVHNELKLAHMDIRLNNICFDDLYRPILIDFDRSSRTGLSAFPDYGVSCMYPAGPIPPEKIDWIQVGWVLAWVLCDTLYDYHAGA